MLYIGPDYVTKEKTIQLFAVSDKDVCARLESIPQQSHGEYHLLSSGRNHIQVNLIDSGPIIFRLSTDEEVAYCTINREPGKCLICTKDMAFFADIGDNIIVNGEEFKVPTQDVYVIYRT